MLPVNLLDIRDSKVNLIFSVSCDYITIVFLILKRDFCYRLVVLHQRWYYSLEDIWQWLETFSVVTALKGGCCWHPVGGGQGCCHPSCSTQTTSTTKNYPASEVSSAEAETPRLREPAQLLFDGNMRYRFLRLCRRRNEPGVHPSFPLFKSRAEPFARILPVNLHPDSSGTAGALSLVSFLLFWALGFLKVTRVTL